MASRRRPQRPAALRARHAAPSNEEIASALREMALFLEMQAVPFKPRAYDKAAQVVSDWPRPLAEVEAEGGAKAIAALPGIGKGIAERITELLHEGRIGDLARLRSATPVDVVGLAAVEGLGPKRIKALFDGLGVRDARELERAARRGLVRDLPGFGEKSEARILAGLAFLAQAGARRPLGQVLELARRIEARLAAVAGVRAATVAGSVRRRKDTIGDLDFLVVAEQPARAMRAFASMPEVAHVHARGPTKTLVRLTDGIDADLRVVPSASHGAALVYFTGSKAHNVALRRIAQGRGLKLNEYGLFRGRRRIAGRSEEEVYAALGLAFIPPELREDRGEIEAAAAGRLPALIEPGDLRGDLQVQSDWTDGAATIEQMVRAARQLGLEYIAITDHTRDLAMTHGLDERRLRQQAAAIRELDAGLRGFRVLCGAEVNIRKDGTLDVSDAALAQLDVVGAAVHTDFRQSRAQMTARVLRAIENPHVDVLFHPTARELGHREPIALDMDAVIAAAVRTGTVLEIDAMPGRLDLRDDHVRRAVDAGAMLAIDSDAHATHHLTYAGEFGVPLARRGWAKAADVVNTLPADACLARLKDGRRRHRTRRRSDTLTRAT